MSFYLGGTKIGELYLGGTKIKEAYLGSTLVYSSAPAIVGYLEFVSPDSFSIRKYSASYLWNGVMQYSTDTINWEYWTTPYVDATSALGSDNKHHLYLRGTNNTRLGGASAVSDNKLVITGSNVSCIGNIETLLDYQTVLNGNHPTIGKYAFSYLFNDCTALIKAPNLLAIDLSNSEYCCYYMFYGCTNLVDAPVLAATTMGERVYAFMFFDCSSLKTPPSLPAITLASYCYFHMFDRCTALTTAPKLSATITKTDCYGYMFQNCINLETLPSLPITGTLGTRCGQRMFKGCLKIKISSTQTGEYQTLYRIPPSGEATSGTNSLASMFIDSGGTFTGTPVVNTTYYTSNEVI